MDDISYSDSAPKRKKFSRRTIIFALTALIGLLLLGSAFYFITRGDSADETPATITLNETQGSKVTEAPSEAPSETPTKSPTPTKASEDTSEDTVSIGSVTVQNGSGESGVAGAAAEILKKAGFNIVSTGNADNFEYIDVTIKVKAGKTSLLKNLEDSLSKDYTIGDTSMDLPSSATYDALIIIGK